MQIKLMIDRNNTPLHLPEPVAGQRLQLAFVRSGVRKFCIQLQPADLLKKSALFDNDELFSCFSCCFLQRMGTCLSRFFTGRVKRPYIRHRLQEQIETVISRLGLFWGGRLNRRLCRFRVGNGDSL